MIRIENRCCDCAVPGYPCRGTSCPLRRAEVHYCNRCGDELEDVHFHQGVELCDVCRDDIEG